MPTVDFATFCWRGDINRIYQSDFLIKLIYQHQYPFNNNILIKQNCKDIITPKIEIDNLIVDDTSNYPNILQEYNIPEHDSIAEENCHGPNGAHYWKCHCLNHCTAAKISNADFIVFSDSDITIEKNGPPSWVEIGINALNKHKEIFMVCPNEGSNDGTQIIAEGRLTQYISQQIFMCRRADFVSADLHVPWNWPETAPNRPMREFYAMLEGRMWRWMNKHNLYRLILNKQYRYWHHNPTTTMFTKVL